MEYTEEEPVCPKCGSTSLIEDNGLECSECGWKEEDPEVSEDENG
jgi:tRNA(Ile2) C34 agmatinyltransferase TiaS